MQGLKKINGKEVYIDSKRVKHGDKMLNEVLGQSGWEFIQGDGTTQIKKTVFFDKIYDKPPLVLINFIGAKLVSNGTPNDTSEFNVSWDKFAGAYVCSTRTNGFTAYLNATANHANIYNFGFTWYAIPTK